MLKRARRKPKPIMLEVVEGRDRVKVSKGIWCTGLVLYVSLVSFVEVGLFFDSLRSGKPIDGECQRWREVKGCFMGLENAATQ